MLPMSGVEGAGGDVTRDKAMSDTAICDTAGCGHVRWRHGPYPANPCRVKGCACLQAWSFSEAEYVGNPHSGKGPHG